MEYCFNFCFDMSKIFRKPADLDRSFFPEVKGFENLDRSNHSNMKTQAIHTIKNWKSLLESEIDTKDISKYGDYKTYVLENDLLTPKKIVVHYRVRRMYNTHIVNEIMVEEVLYKSCEIGIASPRLTQGKNWYIEDYNGNYLKKSEMDQEKTAKLQAQFHNLDTKWFQNFRENSRYDFNQLKEASNGSVLWSIAKSSKYFSLQSYKDEITWILNNEPTFITEPAKKIVTLHGEFHNQNLIKKSDDEYQVLINTKIWCSSPVYDIAHFSVASQLSRNELFEFSKKYLERCGYETDEVLVRDFMFDIEAAKVFCPENGLYFDISFQLQKDSNWKQYDKIFEQEALELLKLAKYDKELYEQIVDHGLLSAQYLNATTVVKEALTKYEKKVPFLQPEFRKTRLLQKDLFNLKPNITVDQIYDFIMSLPEKNVDRKYRRVDWDHFYFAYAEEYISNLCNINFTNFRKDEEKFSYDITVGSQLDIPYCLCKWSVDLLPVTMQCGTKSIKLVYRDFKQELQAEDMEFTVFEKFTEEFEQTVVNRFIN